MMICPVNKTVLEIAFTSGLEDFEDAVQIACASDQRLEAIVTRDLDGFYSSFVPVISPSQLLEQLS
jgi:hypothetical protein